MNDDQADVLGLDLDPTRGYDSDVSLDLEQLASGPVVVRAVVVRAKEERHLVTYGPDGVIDHSDCPGCDACATSHNVEHRVGRVIVARGRPKPRQPVGEDTL
jgi:hypothetical protein